MSSINLIFLYDLRNREKTGQSRYFYILLNMKTKFLQVKIIVKIYRYLLPYYSEPFSFKYLLRRRRYPTTPGITEIIIIAMITRVKLFFTEGILPKK